MDEGRKNFLFQQITSGIKFLHINGKRYKLVVPSAEIRLLGEYVYEDIMSSLRFDNLMTDEQSKNALRRLGIWGEEDEKSLGDLETHLEDQKIRLFKAVFDRNKRESIRKQLVFAKASLNKSLAKKHFLDYATLKYHAFTVKQKFINALSLQDKEGDFIYSEETFWNSDSNVIERAQEVLEKDTITIEEFRQLAREEPWRSVWSISKEKVFGVDAANWTNDQKNLVAFARMYDNAHQSLECPPDAVFEDDDMFDGWLIDQKRKRDREVKEKQVEISGNWKDLAQEVFITAPTREDAEEVFALNDTGGRMQLRERQRAIANAGIIEDKDLPDVKRNLFTQAKEQYMNTVKGR